MDASPPTTRQEPATQLHRPAYEWALWSRTMRVVTDDPYALPSARRLVDSELAQVELAASRFRPDSEICGLEPDVAARSVLLPRGVRLDLGATTRAWAADRCARVVADVLGVGVLVSLGDDIATAGPEGSAGSGAWEVLVQDRPTDQGALIAVPTGLAVATTSTGSPEWLARGRELHLPARQGGMPVNREWRTATVVAPDCVTARTWSTAVLVEGPGAAEVLVGRGYPVRLVAADGTVRLGGGWPEDAELDSGPSADV